MQFSVAHNPKRASCLQPFAYAFHAKSADSLGQGYTLIASMSPMSVTKRRWVWFGVLAGLFTTIALLSSIQVYVSQMIWDKPITWELALRRSFKDWYSYGLVTVGILWFCQIMPLRPNRVTRWLFAHTLVGILSSIAYVALISLLLSGERSVQTGEILTFDSLFEKMLISYMVMDFLMYWLVVFGHLGWDYYRKYCEREVQAAALERELVQARLATLRMQLQPHFLFNTLHAISSLVHTHPDSADRMIARLSELLRLSLDGSKPQEVPLEEELAFLDRYLEIEQTRFADRLTIEKRIDPAVTHALVPYLILQPLVENAVRHGIEPRESAGRLSIEARRENGSLQLTVIDNGAGLGDRAETEVSEGIGISNTRSRLRHLYGVAGQFELSPVEGGGLTARLTIPFHSAVAQA